MFEYTGKIESLMTDWLHKEKRMVFQVDQNAHEAMEALDGKKVTIRLCEYKKKRSLDANAYYWTLVTKLAAILLVSNAEIHNRMISAYGFPAVIGDKSVFATVPDTEEFARRVAAVTETYPWLAAEENGQIAAYAYAGPFAARAAYGWAAEVSIYAAWDFRGARRLRLGRGSFHLRRMGSARRGTRPQTVRRS